VGCTPTVKVLRHAARPDLDRVRRLGKREARDQSRGCRNRWRPCRSRPCLGAVVECECRLAVYAVAAGAGPQELEYERRQAEGKAEEGGDVARQAGFDASAVAIRSDGPIGAALIEYINAQRPRLVVMGTRGLTGLRSALAGSVSHAVSAQSHVPVLVVPSDEDPSRGGPA
jgi:nucleotide-binding universal stress UspA family protein